MKNKTNFKKTVNIVKATEMVTMHINTQYGDNADTQLQELFGGLTVDCQWMSNDSFVWGVKQDSTGKVIILGNCKIFSSTFLSDGTKTYSVAIESKFDSKFLDSLKNA